MDPRLTMGISASMALAAGALSIWVVLPRPALPLAPFPTEPVAVVHRSPTPTPAKAGKRPQAAERVRKPERSNTLADARRDMREERLVEVDMRLDEHAADAGWDPETTEQVRLVLLDTSDRITTAMARVDQGKVSWEQVKAKVQGYRLDQARQVRALLGDDRFDAFVHDMGFERFSDEEIDAAP